MIPPLTGGWHSGDAPLLESRVRPPVRYLFTSYRNNLHGLLHTCVMVPKLSGGRQGVFQVICDGNSEPINVSGECKEIQG